MTITNSNRSEHRKEVWRAARDFYARFGIAYDLTGLGIRLKKPGLVVFEEHRGNYCDGRSAPEYVCSEDGTQRPVIFLPQVEQTEVVQSELMEAR